MDCVCLIWIELCRSSDGLYKVKNAGRLASEKLAEKIASLPASVTSEGDERRGLFPENTEMNPMELEGVLATYFRENVSSMELAAAMGVPQRVEITDKKLLCSLPKVATRCRCLT